MHWRKNDKREKCNFFNGGRDNTVAMNVKEKKMKQEV